MTRLHRENEPPFDLTPIMRRCEERRTYTASKLVQSRDAIDADTEMMERLVNEVRRMRAACDALRELLGPKRSMPVAP